MNPCYCVDPTCFYAVSLHLKSLEIQLPSHTHKPTTYHTNSSLGSHAVLNDLCHKICQEWLLCMITKEHIIVRFWSETNTTEFQENLILVINENNQQF